MEQKHQLYKVYFEVYGKKMKTIVPAKSEQSAKDWVKDRIIFHKIEITKGDSFTDTMNGFLDELDNIYKSNNKK
jgi:hypothetical protein